MRKTSRRKLGGWVDLRQMLLALYSGSHEMPSAEFQDKALNLLKAAVPFDSAIWGTGMMTPHGLDFHSIHLHNEPSEVIAEREHVKHQGKAFFEMWRRPATTKTFHSPTLYRDRETSAFRDYMTRFGHQNCLISSEMSEIRQEISYAHWMSLYRSDADQHYTEREARLTALIAPHLREALRINRVLYMERLRNMQIDEAMSIVDAKGAVFHGDPGFAVLLRVEWSDWNGGMLPPLLREALVAGDGRYVGKAIVVARICVTDMIFLKARKRGAVDTLSARERNVASYVAQGLRNKEIARVLGTAQQTVRNQIQAIHSKLGVHNTAELISRLNLAP